MQSLVFINLLHQEEECRPLVLCGLLTAEWCYIWQLSTTDWEWRLTPRICSMGQDVLEPGFEERSPAGCPVTQWQGEDSIIYRSGAVEVHSYALLPLQHSGNIQAPLSCRPYLQSLLYVVGWCDHCQLMRRTNCARHRYGTGDIFHCWNEWLMTHKSWSL